MLKILYSDKKNKLKLHELLLLKRSTVITDTTMANVVAFVIL